jgi:uncharacterized membrane protein required for colicin V production
MPFSPFDVFVAFVLAGGFAWGFVRGFGTMLFSLAAIVAGIFSAAQLAPLVVPKIFGAAASQGWYILFFVVVFTAVYVIIKKLSHLFDNMIEFMELEWLDSLLGGFVGLLQFVIIFGVLISVARSAGVLHFLPETPPVQLAWLVSDTSGRIISFLSGTLGSFQHGMNRS